MEADYANMFFTFICILPLSAIGLVGLIVIALNL